MTTPSDVPPPSDGDEPDAGSAQPENAPGVEIGISGEGSTFEPEEDPEVPG
jgi:hypothetical protein